MNRDSGRATAKMLCTLDGIREVVANLREEVTILTFRHYSRGSKTKNPMLSLDFRKNSPRLQEKHEIKEDNGALFLWNTRADISSFVGSHSVVSTKNKNGFSDTLFSHDRVPCEW